MSRLTEWALRFPRTTVSGVIAKLKFNKNFLKAFVLALILTPPIMMGVYGHKQEKH
ncbi:MAG: hypothetical protein VX822_01570 [Candidatus Neomarinimicrobiota bacterium]|nr:hypothetical protein [Candidatus Neomarinimicrobiota bacterium]